MIKKSNENYWFSIGIDIVYIEALIEIAIINNGHNKHTRMNIKYSNIKYVFATVFWLILIVPHVLLRAYYFQPVNYITPEMRDIWTISAI